MFMPNVFAFGRRDQALPHWHNTLIALQDARSDWADHSAAITEEDSKRGNGLRSGSDVTRANCCIVVERQRRGMAGEETTAINSTVTCISNLGHLLRIDEAELCLNNLDNAPIS
jgi:hypothetical protein